MILIEQLSKATGPNRDLGREVLLACGWRKTCVGHFYGPLYYWSSPDGKTSFKDDDFHQYDPTASLDTAVKLVPAGLYWIAGHGKTSPTEPLGGAQVIQPSSGDVVGEGEAPTPAIALCIAALKAAATSRGEQDRGSNGSEG